MGSVIPCSLLPSPPPLQPIDFSNLKPTLDLSILFSPGNSKSRVVISGLSSKIFMICDDPTVFISSNYEKLDNTHNGMQLRYRQRSERSFDNSPFAVLPVINLRTATGNRYVLYTQHTLTEIKNCLLDYEITL